MSGQGTGATTADDVVIEVFTRARAPIRPLFELAEDSTAELDAYIESGQVLVASVHDRIIGHLQVVPTADERHLEIKNMAVDEAHQGQGVGRLLVRAAGDLVAGEPVTTLRVATATADVGNLRFYQRQGFRFLSVERDVFTPANGCPAGMRIDGIELRDRIWLDRPVR